MFWEVGVEVDVSFAVFKLFLPNSVSVFITVHLMNDNTGKCWLCGLTLFHESKDFCSLKPKESLNWLLYENKAKQ